MNESISCCCWCCAKTWTPRPLTVRHDSNSFSAACKGESCGRWKRNAGEGGDARQGQPAVRRFLESSAVKERLGLWCVVVEV